MIRPTPSPHDMASECLRLFYTGQCVKPSDPAPHFGLSYKVLYKRLRRAGYPSVTRLKSLGRVLAGMELYLNGEASMKASAKAAGWHNEYSLTPSCRSTTGLPPGAWKERGADLYDLVQGAMSQYTGRLEPTWLREPDPAEERLPYEQAEALAWLERERRLHKRRMEERKAGKRPEISPVHTFQFDDKGRKIYARRPGVRAF